jgi:hypothetical protein
MAVIGAWPRDLALEIGLSLFAADAEVKGGATSIEGRFAL